MKKSLVSVVITVLLLLPAACFHPPYGRGGGPGGPGGPGCPKHANCDCRCKQQKDCPKPDCPQSPKSPDCPQHQQPAK